MTNQKLYELAEKAIDDVFNDTNVDMVICKQNLDGLMDKIEMLLESLDIRDA
jgi:hypothetical protein